MLGGSHVDSLDDATTLPSLARAPATCGPSRFVSPTAPTSSWLASDAITVGSSSKRSQQRGVGDGRALTTSDDLAVTWTESDPDGDTVIHGTAVEQGRQPHREAGDLNPLPASFTAKGETWTVQVGPDGALWSPWTTSAGLTVGSMAPVIEDAHLISPTLTVRTTSPSPQATSTGTT